MWWDNPDLKIVFDPNANRAEFADILVGIGDPQTPCDGIILNQKGALVTCDSVSQYVMHAGRELIDRWRTDLPGGTAAIRRVILEDLSLDTCFALLAFGIRLDGKESQHWFSPAFADYVTAYEVGGYPDLGPTRNSLAILHSVLGHSYFERDLPSTRERMEPLSADLFASGFRECMTFLHKTLQGSTTPIQPQFPKDAPEYLRALRHYDYEYQQYLLVLQHGLPCQLSLPIRDSKKRRTVDALILEEIAPTALVKTLARQDTEHSSTKQGFAVLAIYRRSQAMTGNDITISVDPATGLTLEDLWKELEKMEDERWDGKRPRNTPRNLVSYRERDKEGRFTEIDLTINGNIIKTNKLHPNAPNQPWYDDQGRFTLVGAPKAVEVDNHLVPGTRLGWREDILPLLWRLYLPIPSDVKLEELAPVSGKHFSIARWETNSNLSVVDSPTFAAWLASRSSGRAVTSPADLPPSDSFEVCNVAGGRAYIHHDGVTLFDSWTSEPLDLEALKRTIKNVAKASDKYATFLCTYPLQEADRVQNTVRNQGFSLDNVRKWKNKILSDKPALLAVATHYAGEFETTDQTSLREMLERNWGLSEQRNDVWEVLDRMDATMTELLEELKDRRDHGITSFAVGLGTAIVLAEVVRLLKETFTMDTYEWQLKLFTGNKASQELVDAADKVAKWNWAVFLVAIFGFGLGWSLYRRRKTKIVESK